MGFGGFLPCGWVCGCFGVGLVAVFVFGWRIYDAGDVTGCGEGEGGLPAEELCAFVGGLPWGDVVFTGGEEIGGGFDFGEVDGVAVHGDAAGFSEFVIAVHFAQVEGVHGGGHVGGIVVPVEEVEGEGFFAHQVVIDDEGPDEVVGA